MEDEPNPGLATPAPETIKPALEQLRASGADLCLVDISPNIHPFLDLCDLSSGGVGVGPEVGQVGRRYAWLSRSHRMDSR